MKFIFTFLLSLVLSIFTVSADITINEIMYNPDGIDSGHEWIEIYSDEAVNLSGWKFYEANTDHKLTLINESWIVDGYAIIADEWGTFLADYPNFNGTLFDSTFSLKNSGGEYLALKNSLLDIIDEVNYSDSWGANGNGYTLEKINSDGTNTQGNWGVSFVINGTPGYQNSIRGTEGIDYRVISINEFLPDPYGDDNAPMPQGEWIELYNPGNQDINLKWSFFKDLQSHTIYITDTTTVDTTIIPSNGFLVVYTNGFSGFLNNKGAEELKFYSKDNTLIDTISYEGSDEGYSWAKVEGYWQRTKPTPGEENINILKSVDYVDYVIDGDTFVLTNGERVRLIGIDTPEVGEYYYIEAKNKLKELIEGKQITLEKDVEDKDRYDRLLRYVYINDVFVNLILLEEGFAKAYPYPPNIKYANEFADAEERAKASKIGIWSLSQDYTALKINEFIPNPEDADDAPMPNGEWVELYNSGDEPIDVKGLILNDNFGNGLEISEVNVIDSSIIDAQALLVVYRNGNGKLELNNNGPDKVVLSYEGIVIDSISYSDSLEGSSYAYVEGIGWQHTKPTPNEANVNYIDFSQSSLIIEKIYDLGSDNIAKFGQSIRIKANIYKGDATKNSIALWVEDDKKHKLSKQSKTNVYTRYTNYTLTLPIQITPNCDYNYEDDNYTIIMEGLDKKTTMPIEIEGLTRDLCSEEALEKITGKKFEYELISTPDAVETGKEFTVKVRLINNENIIHNIDIWSYVYRGPKCYSCLEKRDENKKSITLPRKDFSDIELKNIIHDAKPGDYKLKILIKKDDLKTKKEITHNIKIISSSKPNITIEKFYTEEKKPKNEIILTTILKNNENEKINFNLILESFNNFLLQNISIKAKKEKTIELPVNIYPSNNIFFLKLEKNNNILDMKELLIKINKDKIEQYSDTISLLLQFNQTINQKLPLQGNLEKITGDILLSQKEPRTVYESKNIKIKKLIPLFLIIFLVIFNAILIWKR